MIKLLGILFINLLVFFNPIKCFANEIPTVSIAGFVNRVSITNIDGSVVSSFTIVDDYLAEELLNSGKLDVYDVSPEAYKGRLDELALALELGNNRIALKDFTTDYIIYGYLTNLSIKVSETGMDTLSGTALVGKSKTACANLSAKVVDTSTGKIVFTATGKGESTSTKTAAQYGEHILKVGSDDVTEECVHNALARAVHEIADKIIKAV